MIAMGKFAYQDPLERLRLVVRRYRAALLGVSDDRLSSVAPALRNESTHQKTFSLQITRRMRFMRLPRSDLLMRNAFRIVSAICSTS